MKTRNWLFWSHSRGAGVMLALFFLVISQIAEAPNRAADYVVSEAISNLASPSSNNDIGTAIRASVAEGYGNLPLSFEANKGQVDESVKFVSRGSGYTLFLTPTEAVLNLKRGSSNLKGAIENRTDNRKVPATDVIRVKAIGANPNSKAVGLDELSGKSNYLIGNDMAKWRTNVPNYSRVKIEDIYAGIDLLYYGNRRQLEYDWIINPGANPGIIKFEIESKDALKIDSKGDLILDGRDEISLKKPFAYQVHNGRRTEITGRYVLLGGHVAAFQLGQYDFSLPLVIDPVFSYSSYLGGSGDDAGSAIAVDSSGNAYVTGSTNSINFPTTAPLQTSNGVLGDFDVFVTKLDTSGNELVYSTYFGGSRGEAGSGIAVDSSGNAYVTGDTDSTDFPTANAIQGNSNGNEVFVAKLNSSGNALVYSTYLGGSFADHAKGIAVDSSGNAYVTGYTYSTDFPLVNPFKAKSGYIDVFVSKLSSAGNALVYSTYLGGSASDYGYGIAVDSSGCAYVTGTTNSKDFPMANPFRSSYSRMNAAFVTKLSASGRELVYSTYLGGGDAEMATGIAVDSSGCAYVTGHTDSTSFPTAKPLQGSNAGMIDAFVTKLNASGTALVYSTYLGGRDWDRAYAITLDSAQNAYVTGQTQSINFPTINALQSSLRGQENAFVAKLSASGKTLVYSTYLGGNHDLGNGIAVDYFGNAYVAGVTSSTEFPTANPFKASITGGTDAFVAKLGSIKVAASPEICSFAVDEMAYASAQNFPWAPGSTHVIGVFSPQESNGTRYTFANWSDGGAATHTVAAPRTEASYTAIYNTQYQLKPFSSPSAGGDVYISPASSDGYYASGTQVKLTATPADGYFFLSWGGDLGGAVNPQILTMSRPRSTSATFFPKGFPWHLNLEGGATTVASPGSDANLRTGYAILSMDSGGAPPYGTAVFSYRENGVTVSEAGIPSSPPTTSARIFIDYRSAVNALPGRSDAGVIDVNTGMAIINVGSSTAEVTYTLRDVAGEPITYARSSIATGKYFACFINELKDKAPAPDFNLPPDFQSAIQFGSLEISSTQPLSVLALRGTLNQRGDFLLTTTPVADLNKPVGSTPIYFPQFVDGGGYTTSVILLNTSSTVETGKIEVLGSDGKPLTVTRVGGTADSSFTYSIPQGGVFRFQTAGSPTNGGAGWVRLTPDAGASTPVGSGIFSYNPGTILVSESGIPAVPSSTHARVYLDLSRNHNTGLAIANINDSAASIDLNAFQKDGVTPAGIGEGPLFLPASGYTAAFSDQFISGLPGGFTGLLDISSTKPFAALTLRSLINERGDFLMTTFPVADANVTAPSPIVFPQVADGGGYMTEFILISAGGAASTTLNFYDEYGEPARVGD